MLSLVDLSVVIVLYNSADSIVQTVGAVPDEVELILVDNGSADNGLALARASRPGVLWRREPNRGFGAGCNRGVELATRPAVMFLNPDVELLPGAVEALLDALSRAPDSVVGAVHVTESGALLPNFRRRSSVRHEILELLPGADRWVPQGWRRDIPGDDPVYRVGGTVAYVQGACFALMRSVFDAAGGFDERFFLYSEEEDLADRVSALGGRSWLVPDARILHEVGASTGQGSLLVVRHIYRSRVIFYAGRDGYAVAVAFSLGLVLAGSIQLLVASFRSAESRRAGLARFCALLRGLAGGLAEARRPLPAT